MDPYADLYQWEPVEFTTEDNYRLTSFMVTRVGDEQMPLPPIIVQHGNGWDAASWLQSLHDVMPVQEVVVQEEA